MIDLRRAEHRSTRAVATGRLLVAGTLGTRTRRSSATYVIELAGRLDTTTHEALAEMPARALDADTDLTILDLSDLAFIDNAGLHTILMALLQAADRLEDFLIIPGPEPVQCVIDRARGPFGYSTDAFAPSAHRHGATRGGARIWANVRRPTAAGRTIPFVVRQARHDRSSWRRFATGSGGST